MSYEWDAFISYSHLDDGSPSGAPGWVSQFRGEFEDLLTKRLGRKARIWRDTGQIGGERLFDPAIETALEQTAIMIVLYSASYAGSDYCRKEREWFARSRVIIGDQSRILPLRLVNIPRDDWPREFRGFRGFEFFRASESDPLGFALEPSSRQFRSELEKVVVSVQRVLTALDNPGEKAAGDNGRELRPAEIRVPSTESQPGPATISASPGSLGRVTAGDSPDEAREFEALKNAFKDDFRSCVGKIKLLSARKDLHDQLHELQIKFFRPVDELLPRNSLTIDAQTVGTIREHSFDLSDIFESLQEIADRKLVPDEEISWLDRVSTAKSKLEVGMLKLDVGSLREAVSLVDRVLAKWPTRINAKLNESARSLALAELATKLDVLCKMSPSFEQRIGDKVQELKTLDLQLSELVTVHDKWQTFDDDMREFKASLNESLGNIADEWPGLKEKAKTLKAENPTTWAERLMFWGGEMERGLQAQDIARVQQSFRGLYDAASGRFYVADKNLKRALGRAGVPLETVLSHA